ARLPSARTRGVSAGGSGSGRSGSDCLGCGGTRVCHRSARSTGMATASGLVSTFQTRNGQHRSTTNVLVLQCFAELAPDRLAVWSVAPCGGRLRRPLHVLVGAARHTRGDASPSLGCLSGCGHRWPAVALRHLPCLGHVTISTYIAVGGYSGGYGGYLAAR